ncbi:M protein repeat protein [Aphelenchoides besseyi]|nr:M protein repeat protein [Aphelenchoides besseyi]
MEREAEARVQLEAEIRSLKQNLQRREQDDLDEIRSQHQRRIRTYEEQVTDLNETVANLQSQLRSFEQRSRQFETQSQNSFESSTHDYKREYRKTLALLKDAQNLLSIERQKKRQNSDVASSSTTIGNSGRREIETVRSGKAALEKRVSALLQEKSDAMNNARDIEEQLNNALRDYNNHLLQTETNNLTIQRQAVTIAELESEKQRLALQLGELESKNSHFHSHYVEAHKITLLESKVRELQSRVEYERCEKQKYEANVNRLQDEVDRLEDRLNDFQRLVNKHEDEVKRQKLAILAEQEKLQDTKKRYDEMDYKFKKTRDLLEETTETCESLRSDLLLSNRRVESLQAALNTGLDNDEEDSDLDDELNDLDESDSAVTATTGSIVIQTSPRAMSTFAPFICLLIGFCAIQSYVAIDFHIRIQVFISS